MVFATLSCIVGMLSFSICRLIHKGYLSCHLIYCHLSLFWGVNFTIWTRMCWDCIYAEREEDMGNRRSLCSFCSCTCTCRPVIVSPLTSIIQITAILSMLSQSFSYVREVTVSIKLLNKNTNKELVCAQTACIHLKSSDSKRLNLYNNKQENCVSINSAGKKTNVKYINKCC